MHDDHHADDRACDACPLVVDRRRFLRDAALAAVATLAALGAAPSAALADAVRAVDPLAVAGTERSYPIPAADGVAVDAANDVIVVRWLNRAYAFSRKCPHKGATLQWRAGEGRVYCPKHKARFHPDGAHASGRRARDLDRHDIRRRGDQLAVDLAVVRRKDRDPEGWAAAVVDLE